MTGLEPAGQRPGLASRGLPIGYLHQGDELVDSHTVREAVLGGRSDHEWAADAQPREIVEVLLAGVELDRAVLGLSGGERRRCCAGRAAARRPRPGRPRRADQPPRRRGGRLAGRPPRQPRLGAGGGDPRPVVPRRGVPVDLGGARRGGRRLRGRVRRVRAGQGRAPAAGGGHRGRRQNLVRKELAWLRRGPPARTSKPKFRIDAANALIEDVPPPRDRLELQRFATQRLGKDVIDIEDVDLTRGAAPAALARDLAARSGRPGRHRRRQRRRQDLGAVAAGGHAGAGRRPGAARPHRRAPAPHPGARRPRPRGPGAGDRRGDPAGHPHRRRRDHRDLDAGAVRLHRRPADRAARRPVRWGAAAVPAAAAAAHRAQRAAARRAHQRPRHRDAQRARGLPRRLARHARRGLPRPLLPRAGHRLGLGAARRRPDLDAAPRAWTSTSSVARASLRDRVARMYGRTRRAVADVAACGQGQGRQRRGAEARKTLARLDKQLARIAAAGGRAQRRDRRARPATTTASPSSAPSWTPCTPRRRPLELEWLEAAEVLEG